MIRIHTNNAKKLRIL